MQTDHGIRTLEQLQNWLAETEPNPRGRRRFPMERSVRLNLPDLPGVYRMRRCNGDLLYIGKARSLKKRVNSYFRSTGPHAEHTLEMLTQARGLDVTVTGSAFEAAVLEGDEIKRHAPPCNMALRRGQRRTAFCSKDLRDIRHHADHYHRIGPLPSETAARSLAAFGKWFEMDAEDALNVDLQRASDLLGIPEAYAPDIDCLLGGLALFRKHHRQQMRHPAALRVITTIGTQLWRDSLAAVEIDVDPQEPENDPAPQESESLIWTPESVARTIEQSLSRLAYLIRRSRWLCMLSESCVSWERPSDQSRQWIGLVFGNGRLVGRTNGNCPDRLSIPPGFSKDRLARQQSFDVDTYDRLRIVTTELRRLISENRDVRICLGPRVVLRRPRLDRLLRWV
jgi:DNA polymerase-3 subunit epsilon